MTTTLERSTKHIGETAGMANHDHDLVHDLSRRLDFIWRCDQYLANAEGHDEVVEFWRDAKRQEEKNIDRMRTLISAEIEKGCF